jgi:hypothetical protein
MLAKSFAQKIDSNFREMKINCLILAWINISCFKTTWNFVLLRKNIWFFLIFLMILVFVQIRNLFILSHIASYHYYRLVKIHLYQGYFNMLCYWHLSMCCLIRLHVNMLTWFKIINKEINANAKHMNTKMHMETTIMESFQYYSWCSNLFFFNFFS